MGVNVPYIEIREAVSTRAKSLDEVREARLVIFGLGRPENVLIDRRTNDVTGLLDFGQALWGDVEFGAMMEPQSESCSTGPGAGAKTLLYVSFLYPLHSIPSLIEDMLPSRKFAL